MREKYSSLVWKYLSIIIIIIIIIITIIIIIIIIKLVEYLDRKEDPLIQVVRTHQHNNDSAVLQKLDASRQKYRNKQEK